jgi:hypothetical protein
MESYRNTQGEFIMESHTNSKRKERAGYAPLANADVVRGISCGNCCNRDFEREPYPYCLLSSFRVDNTGICPSHNIPRKIIKRP